MQRWATERLSGLPLCWPVHFLHHVHKWCTPHTSQLIAPLCTSASNVATPLSLVCCPSSENTPSRSAASRDRARNARRKFSAAAAVLPHHHQCCTAAAALYQQQEGGGRVGWLEVCPGGRAEKVKRCETAASTGSRPQPGRSEGPRLLLL